KSGKAFRSIKPIKPERIQSQTIANVLSCIATSNVCYQREPVGRRRCNTQAGGSLSEEENQAECQRRKEQVEERIQINEPEKTRKQKTPRTETHWMSPSRSL